MKKSLIAKHIVALLCVFCITTNSYSIEKKSSSQISLNDSLAQKHKKTLDKKAPINELINSSTNNIISSLTGRYAGVKVTNASGHYAGGSRIIVRGLRSVVDDNQPLIVVDGVPYSNQDYSTMGLSVEGYDLGSMASDLNLWDIDSIAILSPNQSSAYGFRGRNGVLEVYTKKYNFTESFKINVYYNSTLSIESIVLYPNLQKQYGGGYSGVFETANIGGQDYLLPEYRYDESWGPKYNSSLMVLHWNAFDNWDSKNYLTPKPWVYPKNDYRYLFNNGTDYQNNIQLKTSHRFFTFNAAYTNKKNSGIYPNSKYSINNLNLNTSLRYKRFVKLFAGLIYTDNETEGRISIKNYYNNPIGSLWQWNQTSIDYSDLKKHSNPDGNQRPWNRTAWNDLSPQYIDNPYWALKNNLQNDNHHRYILNSQIQINPLSWLSLNGVVGYDTYKLKNENHTAIGSVNLPSYGLDKFDFDETSLDFYTSLSKSFLNQKLRVDAKLGGFKSYGETTITGGSTNGGLLTPDNYTLSNSLNTANLYSMLMKKRLKGYYSTIKIGLLNSLTMDLSYRKDQTALLFDEYSLNTKGVELRYIPKINIKYLSKIEFLGKYNQFENIFVSHLNLDPEKQNNFEIGADITIRNNINASFFYYSGKTQSGILYLAMPLGGTTADNFYNSSNNGFIVNISGYPILSSKFKWLTCLNLTHQKIKVTKLYQGIESVTIDYNLRVIKDESFPIIYGTDYVKDKNGNLIVSTNGEYAETGPKPLAKVNPDFYGGFTNIFEYGNFQINILIDFQAGGNMYYSSYKYGLSSGLLPETTRTNENGKNIRDDISDGGGVLINGVYGTYNSDTHQVTYTDAMGNIVTNPIANTTRISAMNWAKNGPDSRNIFSTDYIKLREISVSYSIPLQRIPLIKQIKVSVFGRNIATWTKGSKHFDPEYMQLSSSNAQGYESVYLPSTRTFGCMLNMSF